MNIDGSGEHISIEFAPDFFQKHLAIDWSSSVLDEILKQVEFFCRKFYSFVIFCYQSFRGIY